MHGHGKTDIADEISDWMCESLVIQVPIGELFSRCQLFDWLSLPLSLSPAL